jgi:hypothetical protein
VEQTYANKDFPENISKYGNCNWEQIYLTFKNTIFVILSWCKL